MTKKILLSGLILFIFLFVLTINANISEETKIDISHNIFSDLEKSKANVPSYLAPFIEQIRLRNYHLIADSLEQVEPKNNEIHFLLGYAYFQLNDYTKSKTHFIKSSNASFILSSYSLKFLSQIYLKEKKYQKAIPILNILVDSYPHSTWREIAIIELSKSYFKNENYTQSAAYYSRYQKEFPDGDYIFIAKREYAKCMRKVGAIQSAEKVEKYLWIEYPHYFNGKTPDHITIQERIKRIENLNHAKYFKSSMLTCDYLLSKNLTGDIEWKIKFLKAKAMAYRSLQKNGRRWRSYRIRLRKKSIAILKDLIKHVDDDQMISESYYLLVKLHQWLRDDDGFIQWADNALQDHPRGNFNDKILYELVNYYHENDDFLTSFNYVNTYMDSFPQSPLMDEFLLEVANGYYLEKKFWNAAQFYEKLHLISDDMDKRARGLYWAGKSLEKIGSRDIAKIKYQKCRKNYYSYYAFLSEERLTHLGNTPDEEFTLIDKHYTTINHPDHITQHLDIIQKFISLGLYDIAEKEAAFLLTESSDDLYFRSQLSWILYQQSKYVECVNTLKKGLYLGMRYPPEVWQIFFPRLYYDKIIKYSNAHNIDPLLTFSLIRQESVFNPSAKSWIGARGLMQIMPRTGWQLSRQLGLTYKRSKLYEIDYNLQLGIWYLATLLKNFDQNHKLALASYNGGIGNVNNWLEKYPTLETDLLVEYIPLSETKHYIKYVLRNYWIYKKLYRFGVI